MTKSCTTCKTYKDLEDFAIRSQRSGGRASSCKDCLANRAKKDRAAKNQYYRDYYRKRRKQPGYKEHNKNLLLIRQYGITLDDYLAVIHRQHNKCPVCLEPFSKKKTPVVDHCHVTGKVRGVLCRSCNAAIGLLGDSLVGLRRAIAYLDRGE